ncbi:hypothetical protein MMC06_005195 [Schaereria dolodes]|nr:hypothetical protein [Schaereria dolodes]
MGKPKAQVQVLILLFQYYNALDFAAPLEVFHQTKVADDGETWYFWNAPFFKNTIAAEEELTQASEDCFIRRHMSLTEAMAKLDTFDVLVVPGGRIPMVLEISETPNHPFMQIIKEFYAQPKRADGRERTLMSICTAAIFLAEVGALVGKKATTHHNDLDTLQQVCDKHEGPKSEIIQTRFIDAGVDQEKGMRIITAGGVSCGFDGCLWLVELKTNRQIAEGTAWMLEYAWRRDEGIIPQATRACEIPYQNHTS